MTEFAGYWTTGASVGDQQAGGYTQVHLATAQKVMSAVNGPEGVAADYLNELAGTVTGANTVAINTGGAVVDGKWYDNNASESITVPSAVGGGNTRIDRIVLRCSWAGFTIRIIRLAGTDAATPAVPAVTTTSGTTYDILLYQALVNTAGAVTLTDERAFALIHTAEIADGAIATAKIADNAVIWTKIADLNITTAKIVDLAVTQAKLAPGASKVVGRVGGSPTDWSSWGSNVYTPDTAKIQVGSLTINFANATIKTVTVTYPVPFATKPILLWTNTSDPQGVFHTTTINETATSFTFQSTYATPTMADVFVRWIAIGAE